MRLGILLITRVVEFVCGLRKPIFIVLILAASVLVSGFIAMRLHPEHYIKAFDIDNERNLPAILCAIQFAWIACSIACFLLVPGMIEKPFRRLAVAASAGFLFFGFDEYIQYHEKLSDVLVNYPWAPRLNGDVGAWIPVYAAAAVILFAIFRKPAFLAWKLYRKPSAIFLAGLFLLFCGSVGFEIVAFEFLEQSRDNPFYPYAVAAEEFLEMAGASVMHYGIWSYGAAALRRTEDLSDMTFATPLVKA